MGHTQALVDPQPGWRVGQYGAAWALTHRLGGVLLQSPPSMTPNAFLYFSGILAVEFPSCSQLPPGSQFFHCYSVFSHLWEGCATHAQAPAVTQCGVPKTCLLVP